MPQAAVITKRSCCRQGCAKTRWSCRSKPKPTSTSRSRLTRSASTSACWAPSANSPGDVDVLIATSRKDRVQDRQGAWLRQLAWCLWCSTSSPHASRLAASRVMESLPKDSLVALFEIGIKNTSLKVLVAKSCSYDRDQSFGGSQLTQMISRQYRVLFRRGRTEEDQRRPPFDYEAPCCRPLSTTSHRKSAARCSISSPARRTKVHYPDAGGRHGRAAGAEGQSAAARQFPRPSIVNPFEGMQLGSSVREEPPAS